MHNNTVNYARRHPRIQAHPKTLITGSIHTSLAQRAASHRSTLVPVGPCTPGNQHAAAHALTGHFLVAATERVLPATETHAPWPGVATLMRHPAARRRVLAPADSLTGYHNTGQLCVFLTLLTQRAHAQPPVSLFGSSYTMHFPASAVRGSCCRARAHRGCTPRSAQSRCRGAGT